MKNNYRNIIILLFISLFLFFFSNCANDKQSNFSPRNSGYNAPPVGFPPVQIELLEQQKEQLESDYNKKLEENNKLKKQIEKNIKYIKILLTTGIIMLSIIIYILIKLYLKYSRQKSIQKQIKKLRIEKSKNNNEDKNKEKKIISSSNSSILKSNYNLLNSNKNIKISNKNESLSEDNNNPKSSSFFSVEEEEKNYDAPKIADYSNIVINDDNKTLTNNPDLFIPSRMDKILYKPYSKEEIK